MSGGNYYRWDQYLEAKANTNYNFAGWSGDISSMEPPLSSKHYDSFDAFLSQFHSKNSSSEDTLQTSMMCLINGSFKR